MTLGLHQLVRTPGKGPAEFNTLKSDQILGFIEAQTGVHVSLVPRRCDPVLEGLAPQNILNQSEEAWKAYKARVEEERQKSLSAEVNRNRPITMAEVSKHTSLETGVWFVIDGKVFDATPWLRDHPCVSAGWLWVGG